MRARPPPPARAPARPPPAAGATSRCSRPDEEALAGEGRATGGRERARLRRTRGGSRSCSRSPAPAPLLRPGAALTAGRPRGGERRRAANGEAGGGRIRPGGAGPKLSWATVSVLLVAGLNTVSPLLREASKVRRAGRRADGRGGNGDGNGGS